MFEWFSLANLSQLKTASYHAALQPPGGQIGGAGKLSARSELEVNAPKSSAIRARRQKFFFTVTSPFVHECSQRRPLARTNGQTCL